VTDLQDVSRIGLTCRAIMGTFRGTFAPILAAYCQRTDMIRCLLGQLTLGGMRVIPALVLLCLGLSLTRLVVPVIATAPDASAVGVALYGAAAYHGVFLDWLRCSWLSKPS
jgi:hypothetical protein